MYAVALVLSVLFAPAFAGYDPDLPPLHVKVEGHVECFNSFHGNITLVVKEYSRFLPMFSTLSLSVEKDMDGLLVNHGLY